MHSSRLPFLFSTLRFGSPSCGPGAPGVFPFCFLNGDQQYQHPITNGVCGLVTLGGESFGEEVGGWVLVRLAAAALAASPLRVRDVLFVVVWRYYVSSWLCSGSRGRQDPASPHKPSHFPPSLFVIRILLADTIPFEKSPQSTSNGT